MPVRILGTTTRDITSKFDRAVQKIAPVINGLGEDRQNRAVRSLAGKLNALGILAPNGKAFTFGSTYRVLARMRELGLGAGPSNRSKAAQDRRLTRYYPRRPKEQSISKALRAIEKTISETI